MMKGRAALGALTILLAAHQADAVALKMVTVNAPKVNCVFNPTCKITVTDTTADIPIAATGTKFLQSRTFTGVKGAPANGLYGYMYRIDLSHAVSKKQPRPCIRSLKVHTGSVAALDYNGDGSALDQIFVITSGGIGSVKPVSADLDAAGNILFTFKPAVCSASSASNGQSSFFFGFASKDAPAPVVATVTESSGVAHNLQARAPKAAACSIPPYSPSFWNDAGTVQYNNNCYNYGNNKRTDTYAQPGRAAGAQATTMSCPAVIAAATADGLIPTTATGTCPTGMDKIALVVDPNTDYHWYRQGTDGMWSHKPGGGAATNLDSSSNTISNPETANRCGGWLCYTDFCGYFCTCSDQQQGQGHANIK